MYLRNERIRKLPLVIDSVIVSDVEDTRRPQPLYMAYSGGLYPALAFKKGFVYGGDHGINKVFVKKIAGLDHVYIGRRDLVTINGSVEGIAYNGDDVAVSVLLPNGYHSLLIMSSKKHLTYRFEEVVQRGFTSKRHYYITRIDLSLSGSNIVSLLKTIDKETGSPGPSFLVIKKYRGGIARKTLSQKSIVAGCNGLFTGIFEVLERKHGISVYLHLVYGGRYRRYRLRQELVRPEFIRQGSIVYADDSTLIASDGVNLYSISLKKNRVLWRRDLGSIRCTSISPLKTGDDRKIVVIGSGKAYVLSMVRGVKLLEFDVSGLSRVSSCSICEPYVSIASGDHVSVYNIRGDFIGDYYVEGTVNGVTAYADRVLIGYISPANIPKSILADFAEGIDVKLYDITLTVGSTRSIEVEGITPTVRVLRSSSRRLRVYNYESYIVFRDNGANPGEHYVELLLDIHGFLPLRETVKIMLEKPLSVFSRISVSSRVKENSLGIYLPIILETPMYIDVMKISLWSSDNNVYGTTHEISGLPPGEYTIPLRILWAIAGIHEVNLSIVSWSHAKKFVENIRAKIIIDKDWFKPILKIYGGLTYLWSPVDIGGVRIMFKGSGFERSMLVDLHKGWNVFDLGELLPEKIVITTRSKAVIEVSGR